MQPSPDPGTVDGTETPRILKAESCVTLYGSAPEVKFFHEPKPRYFVRFPADLSLWNPEGGEAASLEPTVDRVDEKRKAGTPAGPRLSGWGEEGVDPRRGDPAESY